MAENLDRQRGRRVAAQPWGSAWLAGVVVMGFCTGVWAAPIAPAPQPSVSLPSAAEDSSERLISLRFEAVDIHQVLRAIADFSGFNVVASDGVRGEVTVWLKDVDWRDALQVVLDAKGLGVRERDGILWVAPQADILKYQDHEIKTRQASTQLAPLQSAVYRLNYAKAAQVLAQISGRATGGSAASADGKSAPAQVSAGAGSVLSARGRAFVDVRTNQLFVTDTAQAISAVQAFVAAVDVPLRQVMIEARIVEADSAFSRNLGVRLGVGNAAPVSVGSALRLGPRYDTVTATGASSVLPFVNLPASGINGADAASFAIALLGASAGRFLSLELSALEADGRGKIVSSPHIVTADQVKATIEQGTEYPYQTATASGATSVEFRKANLKLEVVPQVTPEGYIILDVDIHKDSRGETTAAGIAINTKHVQTQVLVEDGGTLMIGGILEEYQRQEVSKVPGLGDLPVIGNVFKSSRRQTDQTEVVVLLTPRVINQSNSGSARDRTGGDARVGQVDRCSDVVQAPRHAACRQ